MNVILKGNGEKIIWIQQKEQKVIYNGENTLIDNRMPISLSSVNTKTKKKNKNSNNKQYENKRIILLYM